jgi:endonuclease/exonuclease/phosphatase (EEP) superfamily protein YafD
VIAFLLVVLSAVGALRWLDVTAQPVVVLQTAGPFVLLGVLSLLVATLLLRRWWMALPVGLVLTVAAVLAAPAFGSDTAPRNPRDLTVMSANLWSGRADAQQVMDAVRYHGVDVLVLTEVTPDAVTQLDAAGADGWFTSRTGAAHAGTFTGTMIWSRYPLTPVVASGGPAAERTPSLQPEAVVSVAGRPVRVKAAHPLAPLSGDTVEWRAGLLALRSWADRQGGSEPVVLAGDFNASYGHPAFRTLADGFVDAQRSTGAGWVRTWPVAGHRMPPYVQLDHVLTKGLTVVDAGQVAIHGADHAIVWAAYSLKAAG